MTRTLRALSSELRWGQERRVVDSIAAARPQSKPSAPASVGPETSLGFARDCTRRKRMRRCHPERVEGS